MSPAAQSQDRPGHEPVTAREPFRVRYERRDGAGWITLSDPDRGNALSMETARQLLDAVDAAVRDGVPVIVLTAAPGRFFSVGGDLGAFAAAEDLGDFMLEIARTGHRAIARLIAADAVVVTAIAGTAAGIGFPLAACGDLVLAAESAAFTLGYTRVGLTGDGGVGWLTHTLGLHRTLRLLLLNDTLTAEEARQAGLVARVFPDAEFDDGVQQIVQGLVSGSATAQAAAKRTARGVLGDGLAEQLEREATTMAEAAARPDAREGIAAFLAKRPPRFDRAENEGPDEGPREDKEERA